MVGLIITTAYKGGLGRRKIGSAGHHRIDILSKMFSLLEYFYHFSCYNIPRLLSIRKKNWKRGAPHEKNNHVPFFKYPVAENFF